MSLRRCLPLLAIGLSALAATPAQAKIAVGPTGNAFYNPPKAKIAGKHGTVIWARGINGGALPAGRSALVLYRSVNPITGATVPVSGVITLPSSEPESGGWPVVSWTHGTTGIADSCAPSRYATAPPASTYVKKFRAEASEWVRDGWVVAQTDYQGLGTPGMHPYLVGASEGRSQIDIVLAARALSKEVGRKWAAIGHSQGGHATLFAAGLANSYAPTLKLMGAVPLAPASHIGEQAAAIDKIKGNPYGGLPAMILAGAMLAADIDPAAALSDAANALYPQIEQKCLDKLSEKNSFGGLDLDELIRAGYDQTPLLAEISANDPEDLTTIKAPLLIAQGTSDTTVIPSLTQQAVDKLRGAGTKITYKTFKGIDHSGIVQAARSATDAFLHKVLE